MAHPYIKSLTIVETAALLGHTPKTIEARCNLGAYGEVERNRGTRLINIAVLERIKGSEFSPDSIEAVLGRFPARLAMLREAGFLVERDPVAETLEEYMTRAMTAVRLLYPGKSQIELEQILADKLRALTVATIEQVTP